MVLDKDLKGARISDNGRGIPVDMHPKFKRSALELILCTLHAGGKFEGKNYSVSGGLHGVGSSVVNALSEEMVAQVRRDGKEYQQSYARGVPQTKLKELGVTRKRGTEIYFRPDVQIFGKTLKFDPRGGARAARVEELPAPRPEGRVPRPGHRHHGSPSSIPGGIVDYLQKVVAEKNMRPVHAQVFASIARAIRAWSCR